MGKQSGLFKFGALKYFFALLTSKALYFPFASSVQGGLLPARTYEMFHLGLHDDMLTAPLIDTT